MALLIGMHSIKWSMKAAVINEFGGPEVIQVIDIPKPVPTGKEVLVKNKAAGADRPDSMVRSGIYPFLENSRQC